ncbi:MAG: hypothetical protein ACLFVU_12715 [Phycisphaerae bacterium]
MSSHAKRDDLIHVLSMDPVLGRDILARLADCDRLSSAKVIAPDFRRNKLQLSDLDELVRFTIKSRLIIVDVRRQTLPRLQETYNRVAGYNRRDSRQTVEFLLIGDGPAGLLGSESHPDLFASYLADFRKDYNPGAFFYDPFLHYTHDERVLGIDSTAVRSKIPQRFADGFKEEDVTVGQVRKYFRAEGAAPIKKDKTKARRTEKLKRLYKARIAHAWPEQAPQLQGMLTYEGQQIRNENLRLNLYPLFFEDKAADLYESAKRGRGAPRYGQGAYSSIASFQPR